MVSRVNISNFVGELNMSECESVFNELFSGMIYICK